MFTKTKTASLTAKEIEMLQWMADGLSKQEATYKMDISFSGIKRHSENIFQKLNVNNMTAAVAYALRTKIIR